MGANLSREDCCGGRGRGDEQDPIESSDLFDWAETVGCLHSSRKQSDANATAPADHLEQSPSHIQEDQLQHLAQSPSHVQDDELQGKINAIVAGVKQRKQSSLSGSGAELQAEQPGQSPVAGVPRSELQNQINQIVQLHSKSLKEQRLAATGMAELASPSPAKSVTDTELSYVANLALSNAKERKTPATSPWQMYPDSTPHGGEFVRRHLTFADCDSALAAQKMSDEAQTSRVSLIRLPSPSRNCARNTSRKESGQTCLDVGETLQKAAEEGLGSNSADKKEAIDAEKAKEERALMLEMDKICVETFLECVKTCAWRERVRTPIKGTNLYIKHMRPCRPAGTSVDVKDSSFKNLRTFLLFLEAEGLLRLQPGLTDPVVTGIHFKACRDYVYVPCAPEWA